MFSFGSCHGSSQGTTFVFLSFSSEGPPFKWMPLGSSMMPSHCEPSSPSKLAAFAFTQSPSKWKLIPWGNQCPSQPEPCYQGNHPRQPTGAHWDAAADPGPAEGQLLSEWAVFGNSRVNCTKWNMVIMYLWLSCCASCIVMDSLLFLLF